MGNRRISITTYVITILMFAAVALIFTLAQPADAFSSDLVVLSPGDSRSLLYQFDGIFWDPDSYHMLFVAALADNEIHKLNITISPVGDVGTEMAYVVFGMFYSLPLSIGGFPDMLAPGLKYGHEHIQYSVDINPNITFGIIFSAAITEQSKIDFPVDMTATLTLSE